MEHKSNVFLNIAKWEKSYLESDVKFAKELVAHSYTLLNLLETKDFTNAMVLARLMHTKLNEIENEIETGKASKER